MTEKQVPPAPPPLSQHIRLLVALSALSATIHPPSTPSVESRQWYDQIAHKWLAAVCKLLEIETSRLPPSIDPSAVRSSAEDQVPEWSEDEISRVAGVLIEASLASAAQGAKKEDAQLSYTPLARAWTYTALNSLTLPAGRLIPKAEANLSATLFSALKEASAAEQKSKVEQSRQSHSQGWGGAFGRHLATGAGVIAGGVLIGVTGGLAAPAIAALLAPLGVGGILAGGAAPVVLGTLFGVGGGGLAGRRVRERWRGVEEFSFVEVGAGTRATKEEIEDLREARQRLIKKEAEKKQEEKNAEDARREGEAAKASGDDIPTDGYKDESEAKPAAGEQDQAEDGQKSEEQAADAVNAQRSVLEEQLLGMSAAAGTRSSISNAGSPRTSTEGGRPSLDSAVSEDAVADKKKPPSLTATIIVPGLLTVSKTEAITAWRSICSSEAPAGGTHAPGYVPRLKAIKQTVFGADEEKPVEDQPLEKAAANLSLDTQREDPEERKKGLKDGRDVYLLRFETERMLKTGRDIDLWVESKLKGKIKAEIIKRTLLNAYFAAVKLPLSVYSMATMSLDNTWMQAQDRAKKAGRILGEVLEKRVQGERPVILIGSSVGSYTVMEALLYLASLQPAGTKGPVPNYVESAYFISLPSAPTAQEWARCRSVVSRRLVNAWSNSDFVLAGVCRLHEVLSRAATLNSGVSPAGLGPVNQPGVQDVDVSEVLRGHMEMQAKMPEIIRIIDVDN